MNMLIGMLCEVVSTIATVEKDKAAISYVKSTLLLVLNEMEVQYPGHVTNVEFLLLVQKKGVIDALQELGVDVSHLISLSDFVFEETDRQREDGSETRVPFGELLEMIFELRSRNAARVTDVVKLRKYYSKQSTDMQEQLSKIENEGREDAQRLQGKLDDAISS